MSMKFSRQRGVGLVELMISLVIGMIVIAGALSMVSSTFGANASQMKMSRLNNELRMAMSSITRDMRRTGYNNWTIAQLEAGVYTPSPQPASVVIAESGADSAVMHYDENADGLYLTTEPTETYSFRYNNNTIEAKIGTATTGSWSAIVDPSVIKIELFTITDLSQDLLKTTTSGAFDVKLPMYSISITGSLVKDPTVVRTIQETVRLRNVIVS
jgi:type II secretory pathway component PulJ